MPVVGGMRKHLAKGNAKALGALGRALGLESFAGVRLGFRFSGAMISNSLIQLCFNWSLFWPENRAREKVSREHLGTPTPDTLQAPYYCPQILICYVAFGRCVPFGKTFSMNGGKVVNDGHWFSESRPISAASFLLCVVFRYCVLEFELTTSAKNSFGL